MLINKDNWQDVKKYYQGTFVKLRSTSEELGDKIWKITDVTSSQVFAEDSQGDGVYIDLARPYHLDYAIPKKTVYQSGEFAAILMRVPARMWRKGIDAKNTEIHLCNESGSFSKSLLSIQAIEGFVNKPGYFKTEDAIKQFKEGSSLQSAALNPRMFLTRKGALFIDQVMVGRYKFEGELTVKEIFVDDVAPLFKNIKVKVL